MIVTVVYSLLASVAYGVSDFVAAVGARRLRVLPGTAVTYGFAMLFLAIALPVVGGRWSVDAVLWGGIAGVAAIVGFVTFYAALAAGPISLASPLIAVLSALVPISIALLLGERLSILAWGAVVLALTGGVLISVTRTAPDQRISRRTIALSIVAGVTVGLALAALDQAPAESKIVPAVVEVAVGVVVLVVLLGVRSASSAIRRGLGVLDVAQDEESLLTTKRAVLASAVGGVLLGAANALIVAALQSGSLAVVSVLVGLYPVMTILLARILHGERLLPLQFVGVALAIGASVLLALS